MNREEIEFWGLDSDPDCNLDITKVEVDNDLEKQIKEFLEPTIGKEMEELIRWNDDTSIEKFEPSIETIKPKIKRNKIKRDGRL